MTGNEERKDRLAALLAEYTAVPAPPGHEGELGAVVGGHWARHGRVVADRLGNRWCTRGSGDAHIVVLAHLDEVALVVRRIEPDGYLRVHRVGGIPERVLMGQSALVLGGDGPVPGVFGTVAHHYASEADKARVVPADEQYLDIGAGSSEEVADLGVGVGDFVVYERSFRRAGDGVAANALDDRAGLAVLTDLVERLPEPPADRRVTVLASVQEEFSLRGLLPAIRTLQPDLIVSLDISPACDTPDLADRTDVRLGGGPAVHHYSFHGRGTLAGVIPPRWLTDAVAAAARDVDVEVQPAAVFGALTDASFAQLEGAGAPAVDVGIPCRYTHAPVERCDLSDLLGTGRLLERLVAEVPIPAPTHEWGAGPENDPRS